MKAQPPVPDVPLQPQWQPLIDSLLEAVCLVEPRGLRIVAVNGAAARLLGVEREGLLGRPVIELAVTPEDEWLWEEIAAGGASGQGPHIHSDSQVRHADGRLLPVERTVSRVWMRPGQAIYVLALRDQSAQRQVEDELEKLVAELRATLESTADAILVTDLHGGIRGFNRLFAQLWEIPATLLTTRNDAAIYDWMRAQLEDASGYDERLAELERTRQPRATDVLRLRSGRVLERVALPQHGRGRPIGRVCSFRDITEQLASAGRLQLAAQVFESSPDAIFVTDAEHRIVAANVGCERLWGVPRERLVGQATTGLLYPPGAEVQGYDWFATVRGRLESRGAWEGELWHRRPDGGTLPGHVSIVRMAAPTEPGPGEALGVRHVGFFRDLSETVAAHKRIEELAFSDPLTGLPNRVMLTERIEFALAMAQRHGESLALMFLDLDRFKLINDSLGHLHGDRVLVEVARRLTTCVRQVDTVARLGGDEFVLLLHQTDARGAEVTARRVLEALGEPFALEGLNFSVTVSIGIAMFPTDGETMNDLIKNADAAMYKVKERGRAAFRFYQPQMNVDLLARVKLDHAMRVALERDDFRLHYQPQVEFAGGRVVGAEALLRWRDPELGDVAPGEFIPVAEESGFIVALGNWVLREAVRQASAWHQQGLDLTVSVNVSAMQFQQVDFIERVASVLAAAGLPAARLELELTESILMDADEALHRLAALERLGVQLAIDDFGTGYSSFGYLKRFPIRRLKIDRSFVKGLPGDESDAGIVRAMIQLARSLGLKVVAEGVETPAQRDFLSQAGCDEYQGYLFAPALPPEAFEGRMAGAAASESGPVKKRRGARLH